jgi:hypothetical protein
MSTYELLAHLACQGRGKCGCIPHAHSVDEQPAHRSLATDAPGCSCGAEAGHEVVIAAGPDVVSDIERRGISAWAIGPPLETIQAGLRNRPRAAVCDLAGQCWISNPGHWDPIEFVLPNRK